MAVQSIVHITPHLGGGVGRVLSQLACYRAKHFPQLKQLFICLEAPQKMQAIEAMRESRVQVLVEPSIDEIQGLVEQADIVQVEWWHHPLMAAFLAQTELHARMVIWAHSSGLHYPRFAPELIQEPHAFVMTTPASLAEYGQDNMRVIASFGGFEDVPEVKRMPHQHPLCFGYVGALNSAKLHPQVMEYLQAVNVPDFQVNFYGDLVPDMPVSAKSDRAKLEGFTARPFEVLEELDVLVYLLNPTHYGTTENALLEAMAAGVVPIVLDNPVEAGIVKQGESGMVVSNPKEFADALKQLHEDRDLLSEMQNAAARGIRQRFSLSQTVEALQACYEEVMAQAKRSHSFAKALGSSPAEWFLSALGEQQQLLEGEAGKRAESSFLYEETKSSAFHFAHYFPQDKQLQQWCELLREDRCA